MLNNWQVKMLLSRLCCFCGQRPVREGSRRCEVCLEKGRIKAKKQRLRKKLAGLCIACGCHERADAGVLCQFHRQKGLERLKHFELRRKYETMQKYGGVFCVCCGERRLEFLTIDHIDGGGNRHRRECRIGKISAWLKRHSYPPGFQVLCFNCNQAKSSGRECPHQRGWAAENLTDYSI